MRVLAHVHRFPPVFNSGAEWYLFSLLDELRSYGVEVRVAARDVGSDYEFRGIPVEALKGPRVGELETRYREADVVVTHLDLTRGAMQEAQRAGRPLVHLVHNERQLRFWNVTRSKASLVVYNSRWLRRQVEVVQGDTLLADRSLVARPLVRVSEYETPRDDTGALTLVNLSENKGALLAWELAARLPDRWFIGVVGSYHDQLLPSPTLSNVEVVPNGDIVPVYARTGILLMPSFYESWGRTALEAGASAIPTIAHPTPGLLECLGSAGIFANRLDVNDWVDWVRRLDDPSLYREMSDAAWTRAKLMNTAAVEDVRDLHRRLEAL